MASSALDLFRVTVGPGLIGSLAATAVYGITTAQAYCYYIGYPNDKIGPKVTVAILWVLNTAHTIVMSHADYYYLIQAAFNPLLLIKVIWSIPASLVFHTVIGAYIMFFFLWQIFQVSNKKIRWWLCGFILLPILSTAGLGIVTTTRLFRASSIIEIEGHTKTLLIVWVISHLIADTLITSSLCILLGNRRTSFPRTSKVINTLLVYAVNRCILSSTIMLVILVALIRAPHTFWYLAVEYIYGGVFTNSLLATLNARQKILEDSGHGSSSSSRPSGRGNALDPDHIVAPYTPKHKFSLREFEGSHGFRSNTNWRLKESTNREAVTDRDVFIFQESIPSPDRG